MDEIKLFALLDKLEKKFIFKFSWAYFWVLVAISLLGVTASTLFILYGISPTIKGSVPKFKPPKEVQITLVDVQNALKPPEEKPTVPVKEPEAKQTPVETKPEVKEESPEEIKLREKWEEVKALFPESQYRWKTTYKEVCTSYAWGTCYHSETRVDKSGIEDSIKAILKPHKSPAEKIEVLDEMIGIIKAFPEESRTFPLLAYSKLRKEKEKEREKKIQEIQSAIEEKRARNEKNYFSAKARKSIAMRTGLLIFGISAGTIALLSISLVLLSMERTLLDIKESIGRNEDREIKTG